MSSTAKTFVSPENLLLDSFRLAGQVLESNWLPDTLLALWRGGAPIGVAVHEFLAFHNINTRHLVIKSVSYQNIDQRGEVSLECAEQTLATITSGERVLIVDDIFDSGNTAATVSRRLQESGADSRIATVYWKPEKNTTTYTPDYYIHLTNDWIVFPHELQGLTLDEVQRKSSKIAALLKHQ